MSTISETLNSKSHRTYDIPKEPWVYYQEWNRAIFLHYAVPEDWLRKLVPNHLKLDSFNGKYYISLVAFTMERIRPRFLPSIDFISNFHEINIRTYVENDNKKGVYFISIEAEKFISAYLAKIISGLPYQKSKILRTENTYSSKNLKRGFHFNVKFAIEEIINKKTDLENWLTERYCLYLQNNNITYRYDIHHKEWELKKVKINSLDVDYDLGVINLKQLSLDGCHYANGVSVLAWKRNII